MEIKSQTSNKNNKLAICLGDPAGIGTEVTLKALGSLDLPKNMQPLLIGCKQTVDNIYLKLQEKGIQSLANPQDLEMINIPCQEKVFLGKPTTATGKASFDWLTKATTVVLAGHARALVTAPISKYSWHKAGHYYPGQTERLAELANIENPAMLFSEISPHNGWRLNTLLATTHIPLSQVSKVLTPELIVKKLNDLLKFCKKFNASPKLSIAGLNPHAGEKGKIGKEEVDWIIPVLENWRRNHPEVHLDGPISPDICWISAAKAWQSKEFNNAPDGILALYHDQGLIAIKIIAFDTAVNTTLGLPFVRTSPDHGTGFDIASKGIACFKSMLSALTMAWNLSA